MIKSRLYSTNMTYPTFSNSISLCNSSFLPVNRKGWSIMFAKKRIDKTMQSTDINNWDILILLHYFIILTKYQRYMHFITVLRTWQLEESDTTIAPIIVSHPNLSLTIIDDLFEHQSLLLVLKWRCHYINRCQHTSINHIELKSLLIKSYSCLTEWEK